MANSTLVVVPTYNEAHNIRGIIRAVMNLKMPMDMLIIDDQSPDGTADIVQELQDSYPQKLQLIQRTGKNGLGSAYVRGFQFGLEHNYQYICEMDADFSHDPSSLPDLVKCVQSGEADMAVGSRYTNGISIINWPLRRLFLSYSANLYAQVITGLPMQDTTAGFKCIHRKVLETISLDKISSNGYSFQIELHFRAWKAGFTIRERSIIFREREKGNSKLSKSIVWEAIWKVWALRVRSILGIL
jgi:dolichol-phosphate mannosyltransferase